MDPNFSDTFESDIELHLKVNSTRNQKYFPHLGPNTPPLLKLLDLDILTFGLPWCIRRSKIFFIKTPETFRKPIPINRDKI